MKEIQNILENSIREKVFPGCVFIFVGKNDEIILPVGNIVYGENEPVNAETLYDLASLTKSVATASLLAIAVGEGRSALHDKIKKYVPDLQRDFDATLEDCLRYRVEGLRMSTFANLSASDLEAQLLISGFSSPPSERKVYGNFPAFLLGLALELMYGDTFENLFSKNIAEPLGLKNTFFARAKMLNCAPSEIQNGVEICGIVHDESARVFAAAGRAVGHAGLFSNGNDIAKYLKALLHTNSTTNPVVEAAQKGLGWEQCADWMGTCNATAFGKTGFTGTSIQVDSEKGIAWALLSNRTYPIRPIDNSAIKKVRMQLSYALQ